MGVRGLKGGKTASMNAGLRVRRGVDVGRVQATD